MFLNVLMLPASYSYFFDVSCYSLGNFFVFFCNAVFLLIKKISSLSLSNVIFAFNFYSFGFRRLFISHFNTKSLGVRFFIDKECLFLDLGYSHYLRLKIPSFLYLYARKKNLYFVSYTDSVINLFVHIIGRLKRFSVYKNKGLIPFSRIKYMRLKLGKKQQI